MSRLHPDVRRGARDSLPLGVALVPIAVAFGYLAHRVHLSWWLAGLMSATVYGGPSQFLAGGLLAIGAPTPTIVITTFVANLRYSLFAVSLAPLLADASPPRLLGLAQAIADGSYALTMAFARSHPERPRKDRYLLGSFCVSFPVWVGSSVAGELAGNALPGVVSYGFGFATPAIFIAFLVSAVRDRIGWLVMLVAGIGTVLGNEHLPSGAGPVVAIAAAALIGGALREAR